MQTTKQLVRLLLVGLLLAAAVLVSACNSGSPAMASRSQVLPASRSDVGQEVLDPGHAVWQQAVPVTVALSGAEIKGEWPLNLVQGITARAILDQQQIYFHLSWKDATRNDAPQDLDEFPDAVAVQLPVTPGDKPYICMGQRNATVNMLYWRANQQEGENLVAGGYGTLTPVGDTPLAVKSRYDHGQWQVVIARPLQPEELLGLAGQQVSVALAVWDGADSQRAGRKSVSSWFELKLPDL